MVWFTRTISRFPHSPAVTFTLFTKCYHIHSIEIQLNNILAGNVALTKKFIWKLGRNFALHITLKKSLVILVRCLRPSPQSHLWVNACFGALGSCHWPIIFLHPPIKGLLLPDHEFSENSLYILTYIYIYKIYIRYIYIWYTYSVYIYM